MTFSNNMTTCSTCGTAWVGRHKCGSVPRSTSAPTVTVEVLGSSYEGLHAEIGRLRAALDEANTERDMAMRMHNVQFDRANRVEVERDQAVATAVRWEDRASFLEKSHDHAVAQVQRVQQVCQFWRDALTHPLMAKAPHNAAAYREAIRLIETALADQDGATP